MQIDFLEIYQFRNLQQVTLKPSPGINLVYGNNASGKTSILEAINLLSVARSFRTTHIRQVIQHERDSLRVFARLSRGKSSLPIPVGIEKTTDKTLIRIQGKDIKQVSELTSLLPVQVINPDVHKLLELGPKYRRQYLDWGVFHVEHQFFPVWQRYYRTLRQRNAVLRSKASLKEVKLWDKTLIHEAEQLDQFRQAYLKGLAPAIEHYADELLSLDVKIHYRKGWAKDKSYTEALEQSLSQDRERGFTQLGPHRADLDIRQGGIPVQNIFSRGQQKMLVCAMRLAQVDFLTKATGQHCVLLVDDLPAELDEEHRARLLRLLVGTGAQLFITATECTLLNLPEGMPRKMFHVEHGNVIEKS